MKVAIVNDSKMAAEILRRVVAQLPEFTLAWTAYSGEEAIEMCAQSRPDIILMDLVMPGIDGAETTRRIMKSTPCVILVVTATTIGNRDMVFEAMGYGALDAVNTPVLGSGQDLDGAEPLIQKLRIVSRLVGVGNASGGTAEGRHQPSRLRDNFDVPVVAIGASTGGPQALAEVLSHFPDPFPAVVLVVQHVDQQFTPSLAGWLQHCTRLPVSIAEPDARLSPGAIWVAGRRQNLVYDNGYARYTSGPEDAVHTPSIDSLFYSLAKPHRAPRIGVLLTGMGRDGAAGLLALRKSGALTIAQDAATSVVYGMPKAAAELSAATEILPLSSIGPRICEAIPQRIHSQSTGRRSSLAEDPKP
jgi:two-component system, chemotaxis family, response regulator WspF